MTITNLEAIYQPLHIQSAAFYGLANLRNAVELFNIDVNPDFQRGRVWSLENRKAFVGHLLSGGTVQPLIVNTGVRGNGDVCDLVDGKQRLESCLEWLDGSFPAKLLDGREIRFANLDKPSVSVLKTRVGMEFGMVRMTRLEMLELYLKLNSGGVPHTAEELNKVRSLVAQEKGHACNVEGGSIPAEEPSPISKRRRNKKDV